MVHEDKKKLIEDTPDRVSLPLFGGNGKQPDSPDLKQQALGHQSTYGGTEGKDLEGGDLYKYSDALDNPVRTGTMASSIFNLANTLVGAGVLSFPFAFKTTGMVLGGFLVLGSLTLCLYAAWLLVRAGQMVSDSERTYHGLSQLAFGRWGVGVTNLSMILLCFGTMVGYLVITGDMLGPVVGDWGNDFCLPWADRRFLISISLIVVIPLCLLPTIHALRHMSVIALCSMFYLTIVVVMKGITNLQEGGLHSCGPNGDESCFVVGKIDSGVFRALPIIVLAYAAHINILTIANELEDRAERSTHYFIRLSFSLTTVLYMVVGTFGYLTFFEETGGNVLLNYEFDDTVVQLGRMAVAIVVLFSFPLLCNPCVGALDSLIFPSAKKSYIRRSALAMTMVITTFLVALLVRDMSIAIGVAGATGGSMLVYVMPPSFYVAARHYRQGYRILDRQNWGPIALGTLGVVLVIVSTTVTLIDALEGDDPLEWC